MMRSSLKIKAGIKQKRDKSHCHYRATPSNRTKQANKTNKAHLKYDKDVLESSDIDEIPGLEIL